MNIQNSFIFDESGRTLILRGCNVGSKTPSAPYPAPLTKPETASFVGRPFPLEDAEAHFARLRSWGFTFIRFFITWEAIEHAGPGVYDEEYLAYLRKILLIAEKNGISVYMDPHQDVWSRWTGGDGAPAWTLEKIGVDVTKLDSTGAAITEQWLAEKKEPLPPMLWPTNYNRYAAASMFTLFFGGSAFAPDFRIDGESAQDFLQERYIAAFKHCYRRLKNCAAIAGFGSMNEPHPGFIGYQDLSRLENCMVKLGPMPSPFTAMTAASGYRVEVPIYKTDFLGERVVGVQVYDSALFKEGFSCPWKQAGFWSDEGGTPRLSGKNFAAINGKPVSFANDFLKPFISKFAERIREQSNKAFLFIEGIPMGEQPSWTKEDAPVNAVNAFHWYDGATLFSKSFYPWFTVNIETRKPIFGKKRASTYFTERLRQSVDWTRRKMGDIPCLLGEFGLPFDMNRRKAFKTGDYRVHETALSMYYDAIDANLLNSTIWNYTADNVNAEGDRWNGEDLSIFSENKPRAMHGWLRPYPMATSGTPLHLSWNRKTGFFSYTFKTDSSIEQPTEIFVPADYLRDMPLVMTNAPLESKIDADAQRVYLYNNGFAGEVEVHLQLTPLARLLN
ncbi:MAG: cellulase family glycosylhydrolase [Treponema sp.]|jgi:hypothetical protein|nr:cellulase family glycosylhydrolase [Treponema sp.]